MDIYHKVDNPAQVDFVKVSVDKNKSVSLSTFLRAFGMTKEDIVALFGDLPLVQESIRKDNKPTENDALEFIHGILRKGDRITDESKRNLFSNLLFNRRRYDLSKTGRYMLNRKLAVTERIDGTILAKDLVAAATGKALFKAGTRIDKKIAKDIQESFETGVLAMTEIPSIDATIYGNQVETNKKLAKRTRISIVEVYPDTK